MMTHDQWIAAYLERHEGKLLGRCKEAVQEMKQAFPDLRVARGHVVVPRWGPRGHWWLVAPDGKVVDPTVSQFPGVFCYEEWTPGTKVRVGKCMECGEEIWEAVDSLDIEPAWREFCDARCHDAFAASVMGW